MSTEKINRGFRYHLSTLVFGVVSLALLITLYLTISTGQPITAQLIIALGLTILTLVGSLIGGKVREAVAWMWLAIAILSFPADIALVFLGLEKNLENIFILPLGFSFITTVVALPYYRVDDGTPGLNPIAEKIVVKTLTRVPRWTERVSRLLYYQLAKLMPQVTVETVILRQNNRRIQVLLLRREANDPFHASEWAIPGTVVTNGDDDQEFMEPLQRIEAEVGVIPRDCTFVGVTNARTPRGRVVGLVHLIRVKDGSNKADPGCWFDVESLPRLGPGSGKLIRHHRRNIELAVEHYKKIKEAK